MITSCKSTVMATTCGADMT